MGTGGSFPGNEAEHSLHLVPRSRMRGAIPPLPQYVFMAWCLVKHRDNFTFYLYIKQKFLLHVPKRRKISGKNLCSLLYFKCINLYCGRSKTVNE
jgi:hypothetical protein